MLLDKACDDIKQQKDVRIPKCAQILSLVLFININFEFSSSPKPKNTPNPH